MKTISKRIETSYLLTEQELKKLLKINGKIESLTLSVEAGKEGWIIKEIKTQEDIDED